MAFQEMYFNFTPEDRLAHLEVLCTKLCSRVEELEIKLNAKEREEAAAFAGETGEAWEDWWA